MYGAHVLQMFCLILYLCGPLINGCNTLTFTAPCKKERRIINAISLKHLMTCLRTHRKSAVMQGMAPGISEIPSQYSDNTVIHSQSYLI